MSNTDITQLKQVASAISKTTLSVNGTIEGKFSSYEVVSYVDEIVILDDLEQEIISIERESETQDD